MTTIHVDIDGTVTYGRPVAEMAHNRQACRIGMIGDQPVPKPDAEQAMHLRRGRHTDAYPTNYPPTAHGNRFREDAGIPGNSEERARILAVTLPHDCANHGGAW